MRWIGSRRLYQPIVLRSGYTERTCRTSDAGAQIHTWGKDGCISGWWRRLEAPSVHCTQAWGEELMRHRDLSHRDMWQAVTQQHG